MRSLARPLLLVALALAFTSCRDDHEPEGRRLTVLFTTDEHSNLFAVGPEVDDFDLVNHTIKTATGTGALKGGVARRFAILESQRAAAPDAITLSSGDFTQGTLANAALLQTAPDFVLMKRMGYDAVAIGNHEFDYGPTGLAGQLQIALTRLTPSGMLPLVHSNIDPGSTDGTALASLYGPGNVIAPSRVVTTRGGLKVGIVSWMGVSSGTDAAGAAPVRFWSASAATDAQKFASIAGMVQAAVDSVRQAGVDTVIALGHGGFGPLVTGLGDDETIVTLVSGVDLVVSGHSHRTPNEPHLVQGKDGRYVPIVQAGPYGQQVGRVELVIPSGERPVLDPSRTAFIAVDDRTAPTSSTDIVGELLATIGAVEGSFVPATLLATEICAPGDTACYTAANLGDLYYKPLCHTTFFTRGLGAGESNVSNLDTDAMLAVASALNAPAAMALQNYGSIRSHLYPGLTGNLSFADLYRAVPNGVDPGTGTPGFPLIRIAITTAELRLAFEGTLLKSMVDGDYFVSGAGLRVEYDKSRPQIDLVAARTNPFTPGWITRMALTDPAGNETTQLYDASVDGVVITTPLGPLPTHFLVDPASLRTIVTTYFIGAFASSPAFGLVLRDPATGAPISLDAAILRWPAGRLGTDAPPAGIGNAVKDHQALLKYVYDECQANGGELPDRYNDALAAGKVPRRTVDCTGGVCP